MSTHPRQDPPDGWRVFLTADCAPICAADLADPERLHIHHYFEDGEWRAQIWVKEGLPEGVANSLEL